MVAGEPPGPVRGWSGREVGFGGTEGIVLWQGIGCVPSVDDGEFDVLRICDGGLLEPQTGESDLRLDSLSVYSGQPAPGPRYDSEFPPAVFGAAQAAVSTDTVVGS